MNLRDQEYIENRLLAPATDLSDAIERLRRIGRDDLADRLSESMRRLIDECRAVRRELIS
jgi:hypothetical protein